ncbi:hypothetical protein GWK47_001513 [Chionoecetes opilio]|uniref:Uncharacterized protein n=1 Tax=Chionoecetes opilio TaxID=41210 RepID=A0A8J4Y0F7_CHIOP|nr:hypothetical protein GWK47_001513 [Chionoecetes opilio]
MIALTSRDIVAAEAHYHASCYRNYTRNKEDSNENEEEKVTDEFILYHKVEGEAYQELFEYIREDIIPNKRIIPVTSLTTKLESLMLSGGVNLLKDSTKKNMHRRLKSELGGAVEYFSDDKGKLLMVPCCVSLKDVVLENQNLHRELKLWKAKSTDINKIIDQTSSHIRTAIKKDMIFTPWPYHPSDVATHIAIQ